MVSAGSGREDRAADPRRVWPRRRLLEGAMTAGVTVARTLVVAIPDAGALAAAPTTAAGCGAGAREILDLLLLAEQVALTFYYTGLTTGAIVNPPSAVPGSGRLRHLAYVRLALAEEQQHADLWRAAGAQSRAEAFYYPAATFARLGYTSQGGLFLGVLDYLETVLIGACLAAIADLGALGQINLALQAVQVLQAECTHRVLGRAIAGDAPANNVTLEVDSFHCVGDARAALEPFVTGRGFQGGATPALQIPAEAQVAREA